MYYAQNVDFNSIFFNSRSNSIIKIISQKFPLHLKISFLKLYKEILKKKHDFLNCIYVKLHAFNKFKNCFLLFFDSKK